MPSTCHNCVCSHRFEKHDNEISVISGGDIRGGGEGDLQNLSGVLEPPHIGAVPGEPFLYLPVPTHDYHGKHPSQTPALPTGPVQG